MYVYIGGKVQCPLILMSACLLPRALEGSSYGMSKGGFARKRYEQNDTRHHAHIIPPLCAYIARVSSRLAFIVREWCSKVRDSALKSGGAFRTRINVRNMNSTREEYVMAKSEDIIVCHRFHQFLDAKMQEMFVPRNELINWCMFT